MSETKTTYEPALCMNLRLKTTDKVLRVITAADGTVLDALDDGPGTLPRWVTQLVQLPEVSVYPSEWRAWRDRAAVRR